MNACVYIGSFSNLINNDYNTALKLLKEFDKVIMISDEEIKNINVKNLNNSIDLKHVNFKDLKLTKLNDKIKYIASKYTIANLYFLVDIDDFEKYKSLRNYKLVVINRYNIERKIIVDHPHLFFDNITDNIDNTCEVCDICNIRDNTQNYIDSNGVCHLFI